MYDDYDIPNGVSGLSDREREEHMFIESQLTDEELMAVALSCRRVEDVIPAQWYFACGKQGGNPHTLSLLREATEDRLRISEVRLGVPLFEFCQ
ncbi:MAG TPA: hypothetical protein PKC29_06250 [Thermodesulfobacteriota bacterium]|nr:hypothetical protein [Thermodesulfobacteriota bacterium]